MVVGRGLCRTVEAITKRVGTPARVKDQRRLDTHTLDTRRTSRAVGLFAQKCAFYVTNSHVHPSVVLGRVKHICLCLCLSFCPPLSLPLSHSLRVQAVACCSRLTSPYYITPTLTHSLTTHSFRFSYPGLACFLPILGPRPPLSRGHLSEAPKSPDPVRPLAQTRREAKEGLPFSLNCPAPFYYYLLLSPSRRHLLGLVPHPTNLLSPPPHPVPICLLLSSPDPSFQARRPPTHRRSQAPKIATPGLLPPAPFLETRTPKHSIHQQQQQQQHTEHRPRTATRPGPGADC